MRTALAFLFSLSLALAAGCAEEAPPPADEVALPEPIAEPAPLTLRCGDAPAEGEVALCASRLPDLFDVQSEPFVAVDPNDGSRMALAIQTRTAAMEPPGVSAWPVRVYVSEDAGASWRAAATPMPAGGAGQLLHADPLVAFGPDGALYMSGLVTGLAVSGIIPNGPDIYVARSTDLGTSWSTPVLVTSDQDNDRQWLAVGPDGTLVLTWQTINGEITMQAAWSRDGGETWATMTEDVADCNLVSRALVSADGFLVACSSYGNPDGCATRLYQVRFGDGAPAQAGCPAPEGCGGTNMLSAAPGRLVLACLGEQFFESLDGGATWSRVGALAELAPEASEGRPTVFWMEADEGGGVHLLLTTFSVAEIPGVQSASAAHALLLPAEGWRLVEWQVLTAPGQPNAWAQKGEFAGIATGPGAGIVAWVHADHQVRVAQLA